MSFIKSREEYNHKSLDNNFSKSEVSIMFYFQSCDILLSNHFYCFNVKIVIIKIYLSHFFQGLKKLGISIETSYTNIQKLVINHLQV